MTKLRRGLYELLVTRELEALLGANGPKLIPKLDHLRPDEAPDRIAFHLSRTIRAAMRGLSDEVRTELGVKLANAIIEQIVSLTEDEQARSDLLSDGGKVLRALLSARPDGSPETLEQPLIPLLDTTLLTNAPGEPTIGHQLRAEIQSSERVELLMAFIRRSGIRTLKEALRRHCDRGGGLRILTTTYTGSTELEALSELQELGAQIRVSYDTTGNRLHAKAWLFHRPSGFSTAYIGSSNLTHSAQHTGLEWNVRVSGGRDPDVVDKVSALFESYWAREEFEPYDPEQFKARSQVASSGPTFFLSPTELRAEPFQDRLLEQIEVSRQLGHHKNLLVSATGTGKTVMAALDYARLRERLPRARLLFIAHREEILQQSLATFRQCLRHHSFGELWVGSKRPADYENVFASIQSLHRDRLESLASDHFDVVVVDEFHHAAAKTYEALLEHVKPVELLGLTATPERTDGASVLHWFEGRIAAELRLWDAIEQQRLSPFAYYGIHDGLDLRDVPWRRGRGYDADSLTNLLTANDVWAKSVIAQVAEHVDSVGKMRALGFCVSVQHAEFMARVFGQAGIPSVAVSGATPESARHAALMDLRERRVNCVFSVDLFNEGVDVPSVDTVLLLRPSDSATLFLQQLGRGLRKSPNKGACTVLDFVGHHRSEFRFDRRFRALLGGSRKSLVEQVEAGFPFLPAGCHMELDRVAQGIVLTNLRNSVPNRWPAKIEELQAQSHDAEEISLGAYLEQAGLELEDVYQGSKSWSDLREEAGLQNLPAGPREESLRRACGRLLHADDINRLSSYRWFVSQPQPPELNKLDLCTRRYARMLLGILLDKVAAKQTGPEEAAQILWQHPQILAELTQLFDCLLKRVGHVTLHLPTHPDFPLQVHARYSRIEILAACGIGDGAKIPPWQTGVYKADGVGADLLAFTLDKSDGQFSPTTRYRDFAISPELIHWESQSITRADSETGRRYQEHSKLGWSIYLFARQRADQRAFWFLGMAAYVGHEGERPMAIRWKLATPLPGDLFAEFAAALA